MKLLAWCLLIATTGSFACSIYAQWLEGRTLEMRQLVSKPMPYWKYDFAKDDGDDTACADAPAVPKSSPSGTRIEADFVADVREPY